MQTFTYGQGDSQGNHQGHLPPRYQAPALRKTLPDSKLTIGDLREFMVLERLTETWDGIELLRYRVEKNLHTGGWDLVIRGSNNNFIDAHPVTDFDLSTFKVVS